MTSECATEAPGEDICGCSSVTISAATTPLLHFWRKRSSTCFLRRRRCGNKLECWTSVSFFRPVWYFRVRKRRQPWTLLAINRLSPKNFSRTKHSSLFCPTVSDESKSDLKLTPLRSRSTPSPASQLPELWWAVRQDWPGWQDWQLRQLWRARAAGPPRFRCSASFRGVRTVWCKWWRPRIRAGTAPTERRTGSGWRRSCCTPGSRIWSGRNSGWISGLYYKTITIVNDNSKWQS